MWLKVLFHQGGHGRLQSAQWSEWFTGFQTGKTLHLIQKKYECIFIDVSFYNHFSNNTLKRFSKLGFFGFNGDVILFWHSRHCLSIIFRQQACSKMCICLILCKLGLCYHEMRPKQYIVSTMNSLTTTYLLQAGVRMCTKSSVWHLK